MSKSGAGYQLSGTLSNLSLTLAGSTLALQNVTLGNSGLSVTAATLTLPQSLGGVSGTVNNVSITRTGLSVGGGSITLPMIKFGDGSKLKIVNATASVQTQAGGYAFGVSGTLQLRVPQNSQDIAVAFTIGTNGQFSGSIDRLSLTVASTTLALNNVTFDNNGLAVSQASLTLPPSMGGVTGFVNNVSITKDGLKIGGGGATFPFPDFSLGSATTGFSVTGVTATLEFANDNTFKFTLHGTVGIQIPGASASATGSITVNSQGQFSGSLSGFSLTVAGFGLELQNANHQQQRHHRHWHGDAHDTGRLRWPDGLGHQPDDHQERRRFDWRRLIYVTIDQSWRLRDQRQRLAGQSQQPGGLRDHGCR